MKMFRLIVDEFMMGIGQNQLGIVQNGNTSNKGCPVL